MIDDVIKVISWILIASIPAALFVLALRARSARRRRREVEWLRAQVSRALNQLASESADEVLAGLQTIAFVNDSVARTVARPMVEQLTHSKDERIAQQANSTLTRLDTLPTRKVSEIPRGLTLV